MRHDVEHETGTATGTAVAAEIAPLKDLKDYKVAKDDPDVRGWQVLGRDERTIGKVNDLLVDTAAMSVRYLDVELDPDLLASAPRVPGTAGPVVDRGDGRVVAEHHVLIPIGSARLDEEHDRVYLEGMESHDAA